MYRSPAFQQEYETEDSWLGGLGFMLRDYLKNDFATYVCPDGMFSHDDLLRKWDGTVSRAGPIRYPYGITSPQPSVAHCVFF